MVAPVRGASTGPKGHQMPAMGIKGNDRLQAKKYRPFTTSPAIAQAAVMSSARVSSPWQADFREWIKVLMGIPEKSGEHPHRAAVPMD